MVARHNINFNEAYSGLQSRYTCLSSGHSPEMSITEAESIWTIMLKSATHNMLNFKNIN